MRFRTLACLYRHRPKQEKHCTLLTGFDIVRRCSIESHFRLPMHCQSATSYGAICWAYRYSRKETPSTTETKSAKRRQTVLDILANCLNTSDEISINCDANTSISWRGINLQDTVPPPDIARQILWELTELNFRFELKSLDERAHDTSLPIAAKPSEPGIPRTPEDTRQDLLGRCFPGNYLPIVANPDNANKGLTANLWADRRQFLVAFHFLMSSWNGFSAYASSHKISGNLAIPDHLTEDETNMLEYFVAGFYTQSFFNFFGRAPIIPRHL